LPVTNDQSFGPWVLNRSPCFRNGKGFKPATYCEEISAAQFVDSRSVDSDYPVGDMTGV
jgi:hypothetical protein